MTWKYFSFFFTFNRQCCLGHSTLNISSPLHSGHHYFDETSLVCDGPFPSCWFQDYLFVDNLRGTSMDLFQIILLCVFRDLQMSRLKFFIKFKKLLVFISSNSLSAFFPPLSVYGALIHYPCNWYVWYYFTLFTFKLIFPLIAQTVWSQLKYGQIGYFFILTFQICSWHLWWFFFRYCNFQLQNFYLVTSIISICLMISSVW